MFGADNLTELNFVSVRIPCRALKALLELELEVSQRKEYLSSGANEKGEF